MSGRRLAIALAAAAACATGAWARGVLPAAEHHFGVIREADGPVTTRFALVNASADSTLHIVDARANCGCTTPAYQSSTIAPGDTAWVEVTYNPSGRPGRFGKKVVIDTDGTPSRHTFTISGTVIGSPATLEGRYPYRVGESVMVRALHVPLGDVGPAESSSAFVEAYNCSADTLRGLLGPVSPGLGVLAQPEVVPPGEQFIYSVVLRADKRGQYGPQRATFAITAPGAEPQEVEVTYCVTDPQQVLTAEEAARAPRIAVTDQRIDLGRIDPAASGELKATVRLSNRGHAPLRLHRVYIPEGEAVSARLKKSTVAAGKATDLTISVSPEALQGRDYLNIPITIYTNDPSAPAFGLRLVGEITR